MNEQEKKGEIMESLAKQAPSFDTEPKLATSDVILRAENVLQKKGVNTTWYNTCLTILSEWWPDLDTTKILISDIELRKFCKEKLGQKRKEVYEEVKRRIKVRKIELGDFSDVTWQEMVPQIASIQNFKTITETREVLVYRDGVYVPLGAQYIEKIIEKISKGSFSKNKIGEVVSAIGRETYVDLDQFDKDVDLLVCENGILNPVNGCLEPHTPEKLFRIKLPVRFDEKASCEAFIRFLNQVVVTSEDRSLLQEMFGNCLIKHYHYQKSFMLIGEGANGKSTILEVLKKMLGEENCCSATIQGLTQNRFASAQLHGKLVNIGSDLPKQSLNDTGTFKMLTGGDSIFAEQKFGRPFTFKNYAKLVFSCNQLPAVRDDTDAFYRRWIFIHFPNQFIGDSADPHLLSKLTTPEELSGILNWALGGLNRLNLKGGFGHSATTKEMREEYTRLSNPIKHFINNGVEFGSDYYISKDELFQHFVKFCNDNSLYGTRDKSIFGVQTTCWYGVRVLDVEPLHTKPNYSLENIGYSLENVGSSYAGQKEPLHTKPNYSLENIGDSYVKREKLLGLQGLHTETTSKDTQSENTAKKGIYSLENIGWSDKVVESSKVDIKLGKSYAIPATHATSSVLKGLKLLQDGSGNIKIDAIFAVLEALDIAEPERVFETFLSCGDLFRVSGSEVRFV
jgi:P4 family phage/plasmid primase-like protien